MSVYLIIQNGVKRIYFRKHPAILQGKNIYGLTSFNNAEFRQLVLANYVLAFKIIDERELGSPVLMSIQKLPEN